MVEFPPVVRSEELRLHRHKGLGLQAVAASPGQIAYRKGEWIGEITRELVPLNTYKDNQVGCGTRKRRY